VGDSLDLLLGSLAEGPAALGTAQRVPDVVRLDPVDRSVERQVDDGGFSSFFREAYPRIVGQLRLLTGDLASAEDVAQEAFVRAASRWRQLARYDQPEAWVRKTAFRLAIDLLRRAARHQGLLTRLGAGQQKAGELAPEDRAVIAALRALPLPLREVLVLHHCVDLPVEAVAVQLGVNVGTVKSRLYRGRERLVALLREEAPPDSSKPAAEQVAEEERHAQP
jgi:RNA polymerase sigma-70 factor, ECF subfamily